MPPNIVFILTDDQGPWAMGCAGNPEIETPHLDRLAAGGTRFKNFFCTSPVCSPARASLLTGRIPSQHGVHDYIAGGSKGPDDRDGPRGEWIEYLEGQTGYTDLLAESGYRCGLSGKWHLGNSPQPQKSFELWKVHAGGGGSYYGAPMIRDGAVYNEPRYVTDVITDNAVEWLEQRKQTQTPFYLGVHYTAPHSPWSRENHPREIYDRYFNECPFTSVPSGLTPPEWALHLTIPVHSEAARRAKLSGYFAAVTAMDRNVGRLLDWLETNGLRDNTLVIFCSDNGMNMGHHGVYGKGNATFPMNMFEESVKVPFIASHPGRIPAGKVNTNLVSQYDIMPTLLDYAGLDARVPDNLPGTSFAKLLMGEDSRGREPVVVFDEYGPVRMIRTAEWKYVRRTLYQPDELYNLTDDPAEERNLAGTGAASSIQKALREQLEAWFSRYALPERDGSRMFVTGYGQLGRCDGSPDGWDVFSRRGVKQHINRT